MVLSTGRLRAPEGVEAEGSQGGHYHQEILRERQRLEGSYHSAAYTNQIRLLGLPSRNRHGFSTAIVLPTSVSQLPLSRTLVEATLFIMETEKVGPDKAMQAIMDEVSNGTRTCGFR